MTLLRLLQAAYYDLRVMHGSYRVLNVLKERMTLKMYLLPDDVLIVSERK